MCDVPNQRDGPKSFWYQRYLVRSPLSHCISFSLPCFLSINLLTFQLVWLARLGIDSLIRSIISHCTFNWMLSCCVYFALSCMTNGMFVFHAILLALSHGIHNNVACWYLFWWSPVLASECDTLWKDECVTTGQSYWKCALFGYSGSCGIITAAFDGNQRITDISNLSGVCSERDLH